jgi:cytochrome c biogenesis protein ResB
VAIYDIRQCKSAIGGVEAKLAALPTAEDTKLRFDQIESMLLSLGVTPTPITTTKTITGKRKEEALLLEDGEEDAFTDSQENMETGNDTNKQSQQEDTYIPKQQVNEKITKETSESQRTTQDTTQLQSESEILSQNTENTKSRTSKEMREIKNTSNEPPISGMKSQQDQHGTGLPDQTITTIHTYTGKKQEKNHEEHTYETK